MKCYSYEFIVQESINGLWMDRMSHTDQRIIHEFLKVFKKKYPTSKFRVVRLLP